MEYPWRALQTASRSPKQWETWLKSRHTDAQDRLQQRHHDAETLFSSERLGDDVAEAKLEATAPIASENAGHGAPQLNAEVQEKVLAWLVNLEKGASWKEWLRRMRQWHVIRPRLTRNRREDVPPSIGLHVLPSIFGDALFQELEATDTPERLLALTRHAHLNMLTPFLEHPHFTPTVLEPLAKRLGKYREARKILIQQPDLSESSLWMLLQEDEGSQALLELAVRHPALTGVRREAVLGLLEAHQTETLPLSLSAEALEVLIQLGPWASWHVLEHPSVTSEIVRTLSNARDLDTAWSALRHETISDLDLLEHLWTKLEQQPDYSQQFLPGQVLLERALEHVVGAWSEQDPDQDDTDMAIWFTALDVFTDWFDEQLTRSDVPSALPCFGLSVWLKYFPDNAIRTDHQDILQRFRASFSSGRLKRLVQHPQTPSVMLELLLTQTHLAYGAVRAWVAARSDLSEHLVTLLMYDPAEVVLLELAQNPSLTLEHLEQLAQDHSPRVRQMAQGSMAQRMVWQDENDRS